MAYYLAVDIGASSGRHILGSLEDGRMHLEEIYRFDNTAQMHGDTLCWDVDALWGHIVAGMKACKATGKIPATMGIDTWAVDYVLLDKAGNRLGDAVCYRDHRTEGMDALVEQRMPFDRLYDITGIQKISINTIYQLMALSAQQPELLARSDRLLMMPEYFHWLLTGQQMNEYTNATSTALVNARTKEWDDEILSAMGFPKRLFGPLHMPGEVVGSLRPEVAAEVGFDCTVVLPATHDTGSAFLAVPAKDDDAVYISSGTWSLLGVENSEPILTPQARAANFTNEGGYAYRFRFLKNIMGLWMLQSIRRELGKVHSYPEMAQMAQEAGAFAAEVDVNEQRFMAPESMMDAVRQACRETAQLVPETTGQLLQCVYLSLASCYRRAIQELSSITGKAYTSLNIVGGGSQDAYLNQLTANATGMPVYAGPTEGTVIGNLMVQMLRDGVLEDLAQARGVVRRSFDIKTYHPQ